MKDEKHKSGDLCTLRGNYAIYKTLHNHNSMINHIKFGIGNGQPVLIVCSVKETYNYIVACDCIGWTGNYCVEQIRTR